MQEFRDAENCHICEKSFNAHDIKRRNYCHFTDKYRRPAHQGNVNYKDVHEIPIVFHNLSGYDSHFFIKALTTSFEGKLKLFSVNKEEYIYFTKDVDNTNIKLRFINSFRFMPSSLEKLALYLTDDGKSITQKLYSTFPSINEIVFDHHTL